MKRTERRRRSHQCFNIFIHYAESVTFPEDKISKSALMSSTAFLSSLAICFTAAWDCPLRLFQQMSTIYQLQFPFLRALTFFHFSGFLRTFFFLDLFLVDVYKILINLLEVTFLVLSENLINTPSYSLTFIPAEENEENQL